MYLFDYMYICTAFIYTFISLLLWQDYFHILCYGFMENELKDW
jgi:hypothetical protein